MPVNTDSPEYLRRDDPWMQAFWAAEREPTGRLFSENIRAGVGAAIDLERGAILEAIGLLQRSGTPAEGIVALISERCKLKYAAQD